ncbi:hypothetical protein [Streptomyces sp. NBC_00083]|uniref:hypothetical protein n=1 Tax=Streptomyces sp. NBC_00083 TaxID=2975647 RepID=UPI002258E7A7|nr:hypothetical protein [Streptomyces sp. NBC_00083]MCX5386676.1 hypothetical protein [Streptomyces sp. NBC_00083]
MRTVGKLTATALAGAALTGAALLGVGAGTALADSPSPSPTASKGDAAPTEAGTAFRTAVAVHQGQQATASGSSGDYLYWMFPADAGQRPTVTAKVTLPDAASRHGASTWRVDVYDGLRRRQPCMYGMQSRSAAQDAATVELSCTLRPTVAWADTWSTDPLPGTYYIRLTAVSLPETDRGLPFKAEVEPTVLDTGGAHAVDGTLSTPLGAKSAVEPDGGWASGWWTDRWLWTAAGGLLAALAGIGGYNLTRGRGRPSRVPHGS